MNVFKKILIGLSALVLVLALISFFLPTKLEMSRSIVVATEPAAVFEVVADFDQFNNYSPWHVMDPEAKTTIEGTKGEAEYKYSWEGDKVGKGSMTRTETTPNSVIVNDLYFADFDAHSEDKWTFESVPEGVKVTWWSIGQESNNPMMRYMNVLMKGALEDQFDQGLTKLKEYCEKMPIPVQDNMGAEMDSTSEEVGS